MLVVFVPYVLHALSSLETIMIYYYRIPLNEVLSIEYIAQYILSILSPLWTVSENVRASLVAQWLRVCLPMQGHGFKPWSGKIPHATEQLGP